MENPEFSWNDDGVDVDIPEYEPHDRKKGLMDRVYDFIHRMSNYIALTSLILVLFRYVLNYKNNKFLGVRINTHLSMLFFFFGAFSIVSVVVKFLLYMVKAFASTLLKRHLDNVYKLITISVWLWLNRYFLERIRFSSPIIYKYVSMFSTSALLTSIMFTFAIILMEKFYIYFLRKSLSAKINDIDMREKIVAAMKAYRYEISETSSMESQQSACLDFFCRNADDNSEDEQESHINLMQREEDNEVGTMFLKKPEILNVFDAKTLARDVFQKASKDGEQMTFEDFAMIFPNAQIAFQAFAFFDSNANKVIDKKDFRDALVTFYADRMNLEKNINIIENFVNILSSIFYTIILAFLSLAYLVIFGISIKDLLAFALSSALVLNFAVSGMAKDLYFNLMVILSHPFDVGDDVIIEGADYKVFQIGLSSSAFLCPNGGKIKFLNSDLWNKCVINMTRAPEKKIVFQFVLDSSVSMDSFKEFQRRVLKFVKEKKFDYFEKFSLESTSENSVLINQLKCSLILRFRSYKTRSKKFYLRVEFSKFLNETFEELNIKLL